MTRRLAAAFVVAALVGLAGCSSNDDAAVTSPTVSTSPTASAMVVTTGLTSGSAPSAVLPSAAPTPSPSVLPTPSVIDVPTPTPANPWPADLTPEQVVDAQAALTIYSQYQSLINRAGAEPGKDWTNEVSAVATAAAEAQLTEALVQTAARGQRTTGESKSSPTVTSAAPALVVLSDCVDSTEADFLDANGQSIKAPNVAGSYYRHVASAQLVQLQDATWRVAFTTDDWSTTC